MRTLLARLLLWLGLSPNAVTVIGTAGMLVAAVGFAARGELIVATVIGAVSAELDLVDGEMARIGDRATRFGALLDASLDRVADGAIFACLARWLFTTGANRAAIAALLCLMSGYFVSYVAARAEAFGLPRYAGFAHRFVRLRIIAVGGVLGGLGVPHGLEVVLWLLAALSTFTAWQRIDVARRHLAEPGCPSTVRRLRV
jgi:CDP-diacylglycerol--glycerol-3-phosphate 3-phosphatidyltransferase